MADAACADMDVDAAEDVLLAADIICSLRHADLAGWTPPWHKPAAAPVEPPSLPLEGELLVWPAVTRGKRSRRRSPSAGSAATSSGKGRWGRGSPASPLDYSGASASTSGGEDGGFCSPLLFRRAPVTKRLPEVKQLVLSLGVENGSLREEMRALQRACRALSKENDKLETRLDLSNSHTDTTSKEQKGKQQIDQQSVTQSPRDSFVLPDLNLPPQDMADVPAVH